MKGERAARRHPASEFPEITGIRLAPGFARATLLNLSATGVLVECTTRVVPGTALTVHFEGSFSRPSIDSRVTRCVVTGIAKDGSLRFHVGLAFSTRLSLDSDGEDDVDELPSVPPPLPQTVAAARQPVLRNRW